MHHHMNWWAVAFFVTTVANNAGQYLPEPGSCPGFVSSPWWNLIFHTIRGVLAANPMKSLKTTQEQAK